MSRSTLATRSSLGSKLLMALTGLTLSGWTILHMAGNLLVFAGPDTINRYGAALQGSPLVWVMRAALLALVTIHIVRGAHLYRMAGDASHGPRRRRHRVTTTSARTMRAGGVVIALFTLFHVIHIFGVGHADYHAGDVFHNVTVGLSSPLVAGLYLLATVVFCAHLRHGLWSAARSLGMSRHRRLTERAALAVALTVGAGFSAPCLAALAGCF